MKKLILSVMIIISFAIFAEYDFPMKNPYIATIVGSSQMMTEGVPKEVPIKEYTLNIKGNGKLPESLWFEEGFKFSLSKQDREAPLIFILSGTGGTYDDTKTKNFQKIFYNAGYHVLTVTSTFNSNFIINSPTGKVPALIINDGLNLYAIMEAMLERVKKDEKIKIKDFYLTGYSMGATHSAVLSFIDSKEKTFNFKRVFMINPSIDLYYSAGVLDGMLFNNIENKAQIQNIINKVINQIKGSISTENLKITEESIYSIFFKKNLSDKELETLIGLAFNLISIDLNYVVDQVNNMHVYYKNSPGKFTNMYPYFYNINFASFQDYLTRLVYPNYLKTAKKNRSFNEMVQYGNLRIIRTYLEKEKKIVAVTNEDDFILSSDDRKFIKETFKERSLIYPYGGHCGNMFYQTNVDKMLEFFETGVFNNEL